jgi:hypothetical protein
MFKSLKNLQLTTTDRKTHTTSEMELFLNDVRRFNDLIGSYERHILADDFTYSIKLSNGVIIIYTDELDDIKALPQERLRDIAARFRERKASVI